ncbi:MAG: solute:sodium symporter family transporter, partial [Planctomycetota bacterium]
TIASFLVFTGLVAGLTFVFTRRHRLSTSSDYFLAGRGLSFPLIAGSLLLTNLSTEQMVGLNGAAFNDGFCVMVWEVLAVVALVVLGLFFLPRYLKSGITTVPEFLEKRYDSGARVITNFIFLLAYAGILLPIILYSGATGLSGMLDLKELTGIESETTVLWLTVWFVGLVGSTYAIVGGLRTVAVSDTLNGIGLLVGGFLIVYFALDALSEKLGTGAGVGEGLSLLKEKQGKEFNSLGGPKSSVPYQTMFTGIILLNLFYWCTNQQIIQRTFGAKNLAEGQKGVFLTGFFKLLGPLYLVLPGMIAVLLFADDPDANGDKAYGRLVNAVLPAALTGFFAAVMTGAILSSFNSALNSTTTLFSLGIYKRLINQKASDEEVVRSGKVFGWAIAIVAMTTAPLLAGQESIFGYLQKMNGIYFIPIFSVMLVGAISKRAPAIAAKVGLIGGLAFICAGYFLPAFPKEGDNVLVPFAETIHEFHFLGIAFWTLIVVQLLIRMIAPQDKPWEQEHSGDVDVTPWRFAPLAGIALIVIVFLIFAFFADFSAFSEAAPAAK